MTTEIILAAQALASSAMCGLIWFVQMVHYPLFAHTDTTHSPDYPDENQRRTAPVVIPPMLVEAATADAQASVAEAVPAQPKEPEPSTLRVLLAEDNPMNAAVARAVLTRCGVATPLIVGDGELAVDAFTQAAQSIVPQWSVILLDSEHPRIRPLLNTQGNKAQSQKRSTAVRERVNASSRRRSKRPAGRVAQRRGIPSTSTAAASPADVGIHLPHHAKVQVGELAIPGLQQITRMRICSKDNSHNSIQ